MPGHQQEMALELYIRKACQKHEGFQPEIVFDPACSECRPTLRKDRHNKVLLYLGSFHPPHKGHMAVLQSAFFECRERENIVAAFVVVRGDSSETKDREQGIFSGHLNLTCAQRAVLFCAEGESASWY